MQQRKTCMIFALNKYIKWQFDVNEQFSRNCIRILLHTVGALGGPYTAMEKFAIPAGSFHFKGERSFLRVLLKLCNIFTKHITKHLTKDTPTSYKTKQYSSINLGYFLSNSLISTNKWIIIPLSNLYLLHFSLRYGGMLFSTLVGIKLWHFHKTSYMATHLRN